MEADSPIFEESHFRISDMTNGYLLQKIDEFFGDENLDLARESM